MSFSGLQFSKPPSQSCLGHNIIFSCSKYEALKSSKAVWPLVPPMFQLSYCFIALSFLLDHRLHVALHLLLLIVHRSFILFLFLSGLNHKGPSPIQLLFNMYELMPLLSDIYFCRFLMLYLDCWVLKESTQSVDRDCHKCVFPQHPCIIFFLVPCQVHFPKPIRYFHYLLHASFHIDTLPSQLN